MRTSRLPARLAQLALLALVGWFIWQALRPQLAGLTLAELAAWRPHLPTLLVSFALLVGVYLMHALLWRRILRDLRLGTPSLRDTLSVYFLSSLGRYLPGKVWQLAGMAVLAGKAGLPPIKATAAAVLGQIAYLLTGLVFLAACLPEWRTIPALRDSNLTGWMMAAAAALALGAALIWVVVATRFGHGMREWVIGRAGERAGEKVRRALELADTIRTRDAMVWAVFYLASWVLLAGAFVVFTASFVPDAWQDPRYLAGTIAASYLFGYFLPLPAGIGAREGFMVLLLGPVTGAGAAVVISVLSRVWFTAAELVPLMLLPLVPAASTQKESV